MMTVNATVFKAARRTFSDKRKETKLLQIPGQSTFAPQLVIEPAGQRYKQTDQLFYLGGSIHEHADLS